MLKPASLIALAFVVAQASAQMQNQSESDAGVAARRARAEELLKKGAFKIAGEYDTASTFVTGRWTEHWEALPSSGGFRYYITESSSLCYRGQPKADFTVDANGMLRITVTGNVANCQTRIYIFDPITKVGSYHVIDMKSGVERPARSTTKVTLLD